MKSEELNTVIRETLTDLSNTYKKSAICNSTLGPQSAPHFHRFMEGASLGIKPLSRMIDTFGYELRLVCIQKQDQTNTQYIEQLNQLFITNAKIALSTHLDQEKEKSATKKGTTPQGLATVTQQFLST